jgi:hypothetical protein
MGSAQNVKNWLDEDVSLPKRQRRETGHVSMFDASSRANVRFKIVGGDFLNTDQSEGVLAETSIVMPVLQRPAYGWAIAGTLVGVAGGPFGMLICGALAYAIGSNLKTDGIRYGISDIDELEILSASSKRAVGRGIVGAAIGTAAIGGAGAIAGAVVGSGDKSLVNASLTFKDGKRALIRCSADDFAKLKFASAAR